MYLENAFASRSLIISERTRHRDGLDTSNAQVAARMGRPEVGNGLSLENVGLVEYDVYTDDNVHFDRYLILHAPFSIGKTIHSPNRTMAPCS